MTREEATAKFSDYLEHELSPPERDQLQAYLAEHPGDAAALIALDRTLSVLHRLPPQEPSLDLWDALVPEIEQLRAKRRQSLPLRLRGSWSVFVASVSEGVILWTHALARRAHHHLAPHLHADKESL